MYEAIPEATEAAARELIDAALTVHRSLGPGLLESVYETCLCHELSKRGVPFQRQVALPAIYDGVRLEAGLRLDLWIDASVIVELKAVEHLIPLYEAQLLTYLKHIGNRLGILIKTFNVPLLKDGIKRLVR